MEGKLTKKTRRKSRETILKWWHIGNSFRNWVIFLLYWKDFSFPLTLMLYFFYHFIRRTRISPDYSSEGRHKEENELKTSMFVRYFTINTAVFSSFFEWIQGSCCFQQFFWMDSRKVWCHVKPSKQYWYCSVHKVQLVFISVKIYSTSVWFKDSLRTEVLHFRKWQDSEFTVRE